MSFFFQAEDGIRDGHVTGVQTCALPISAAFVTLQPGWTAEEADLKDHVLNRLEPHAHPRRVWTLPKLPLTGANKADRSEERRVGKEWGYRGAGGQQRKTTQDRNEGESHW